MKETIEILKQHKSGLISVTELVFALHERGLHLSSIGMASATYTVVIGELHDVHAWIDIKLTDAIAPKR